MTVGNLDLILNQQPTVYNTRTHAP